ncbi:MAG: hypothetical protein H7A32_05350 [Deltaproteobacteria bacterium]|nr:hypothetical protein [Deltaproteobacteria bacterium]
MIIPLWLKYTTFGLLGGAALLTLIRLLIGPTLTDRLIAFDLLAIIGVAFMVVLAATTKILFFFDSVLIWSFLAFIGTATFAKYLEKKAS